jgi:hypothetical protein
MGRQLIIGIIIVSTSLLLPLPTIAGDLCFSWGYDQQIRAAMPMLSLQTKSSPSHRHTCRRHSIRRYQYFPSVRVYHDAERGLYFFLQGTEWRIAVALPSELRLQLRYYVTLEMDSDKPYLYNDQHEQQYPAERVNEGRNQKGKI